MSDDSKKIKSQIFDITSIQRYLLYALCLILPLAIIPLSWDWNERVMSLCILIFSTLILGLEIVKLVWYGKISILKTALDGGILLLVASYTISTIFSKDLNSSIWGIDGRLGNGFVLLVTMMLFAVVSRSFLTDIKHVKTVLFSFLIGITICNVLSIFTFLGVNIWEGIPLYRNFFQGGLPLIRLTKAHLLTNILALVVSFGFIGEFFISKSKREIALISLPSSLIAIVNILLYSMVQGLWIVIVFLVLFVLYNLLLLQKLKLSSKSWKSILVIFLLMTICISIPFALLQIGDIRDKLLPKDFNLVGQVFLGNDASWRVSSSLFVSSVKSAIVGLGTDTYSIAYNMFKPLSPVLLAHNNVTFYNAGNEVFTQLTNGGLLWFAVWTYIGFLICKVFIFDIKNIKIYKDKRNLWYIMIINLLILTLFVSSFTVVYSVINYFILILLFSLRGIVRNILIKDSDDKFLLKLWATSSSSPTGKDIQNVSIFFTILVGLLVVGLSKVWFSKLIADFYVLSAESYALEQVGKKTDSKNMEQLSENVLDYMIDNYIHASNLDPNNPLYKRKLSLLYLEKSKSKAKTYLSVNEKNRDPKLYEEIGKLKNYAIDYSRKSIDISSNVYANWESSINVYMGLVSLGYRDNIADAVISLNKAIDLNPLNYELYYGKAQIHILNNEIDEALKVLSQGLSINPEHIPSLMLSAELNNKKGNSSVYESYLRAVQKILELRQKTNSDIYKEVLQKIENLGSEKKSK